MTQHGGGFGMGSPPGGYGGGGYGPVGGPSILGGGGPVPAGGGARPPKKSGSGGLIALVVLAVALLGGIIVVFAVMLSGKGGAIAADPSTLPSKRTSVAFKHLPAGCDLVVRANSAKMLEVPAMKTHVAPVLDEIRSAAAKDEDERTFAEFFEASGIDAKNDLKDFAACMKGVSGPANDVKFLLVAAGELRPETVVAAWEKVDRRSKDAPIVSKTDGRMVGRARMTGQETMILGQAADGAIVFSNDEALFAGAAQESEVYRTEYGLPTEAEAAVAVGAQVVRDELAQGGPNPFLKDVNAITRITGTASASQAKVEVRIATSSPQAAKGLVDVYNLMLAPVVKQELARERKMPGVDVVMGAKPVVEGNDFVMTAQGTPADVEAVAKELARLLREELKKGTFSL